MVKLLVDERALRAQNGLMLVISYITLLVTNTLVIYLANMFFPTYVVLGTFALTSGWALCLSASKLALIGTLVMPFVAYKEWKMKKDFAPRDWMLLYFVVNTISLWAITRYAEIYGLGVSSWIVIVILAVAMNMAQGIAMMQLGKVKIK